MGFVGRHVIGKVHQLCIRVPWCLRPRRGGGRYDGVTMSHNEFKYMGLGVRVGRQTDPQPPFDEVNIQSGKEPG